MSYPKIAVLSLAASISVLLPTFAYARSDDAVPVAKVSYKGLDISSAAGRLELRRRVKSAAHIMCDEGGVRDLYAITQSANCVTAALSSGETQIAAIVNKSRQLAQSSGIAIAGR